jgi:hypothetical protein
MLSTTIDFSAVFAIPKAEYNRLKYKFIRQNAIFFMFCNPFITKKANLTLWIDFYYIFLFQ